MSPPPAPTSRAPAPVVLVCVAAGLAAAGAGWMLAGVFDSMAARVLALVAAALGASLVVVSHQLRRPSSVQYLALPVALLLGAAVVLPDAGSGSASLPSLVQEALFSGGLGQPPVPFDPGWRFLLVVVVSLLAAGSSMLAMAAERANVGVALSVPLVVVGALAQPSGSEVVSAVVAFGMLILALAVAYGVELARSGVSSPAFEVRRLIRGLGGIAVLAVGLAVLANVATFLLPPAQEEQVIPPQRPPAAPPQVDRELFAVDADRKLPWRLGVLDVYEDDAWKTPPFDPARFVDLAVTGVPPEDGPGPAVASGGEVRAAFTLFDLPGRVVPTLALPHRVTPDGDAALLYDPRTQTLRLPNLAPRGLSYEVAAAGPPTADALSAAGPVPDSVRPFLAVPAPPRGVAALLAEAPDADAFARLQFVRERFYEHVVAAGAGDPVDVPPARVDELLAGAEGSPYEITAAEALLARWVGVPSRIGYGFFGGDEVSGGFSVRPIHGSAWLEVYFEGEGWVPIVGKPPRARSSFTDSQKNDDPAVLPTDELALITYVPIRLQSITLQFQVIRHYLLQVVPIVLAWILAIVFLPVPLRRLRRWRRQRWADRVGPAAAVAAAYAELRDAAWDLNIGQPADTPLEFTRRLDPDEEHSELAWLVTRTLWGDLSRDLEPADVAEAAELSRSVTRRMRDAQPASSRIIAAAARASLRAPWSTELPNTWVAVRPARRLRRALGTVAAGTWRRLARRLPARFGRRATTTLMTVIGTVIMSLFLSGCATPLDLVTPAQAGSLPAAIVPDSLDGLTFQREPAAEVAYEEGGPDALVTEGRVWSVRLDDTIEASLQVAAFRPGLYAREAEVRDGILRSLGGGRFEPARIGADRVQVLESVEQRFVLWFAPNGRYYQLLVARRSFEDADRLMGALLAFQRGEPVASLDAITAFEPDDPRRGLPG